MPGLLRRVVLVAGPPCAGKSTYVASRRGPGDLVADFDEVARRLGSPGKWMHSRSVGDAAEREMQSLIDRVADIELGVAWVVRCVPDPFERCGLAERLRAEAVVLLPSVATLTVRARERPAPAETIRSIWRWLDRYAPAPGDELLREVA